MMSTTFFVRQMSSVFTGGLELNVDWNCSLATVQLALFFLGKQIAQSLSGLQVSSSVAPGRSQLEPGGSIDTRLSSCNFNNVVSNTLAHGGPAIKHGVIEFDKMLFTIVVAPFFVFDCPRLKIFVHANIELIWCRQEFCP